MGAAILNTIAAVALLRAVLAEHCPSDSSAGRHLAACARQGVDPLDFCAHHFGLGNETVWRRAAAWAGYCFASDLPARPRLLRPIDHLHRLSGVRSVRLDVLGEERSFVAPRFDQVLSLKASLRRSLHDRIRFAPPEAIERALTRAARTQLMDNARQQMTLRWPDASAAGLRKSARIGFAAALAVIAMLFMLSGVLLRPLLIPLAALLLMGPGLMRLAAALPRRLAHEPRQLRDAELPVYTVLIPLRDEAHMVPQLQRAMAAIDYPPHLLDIRFVVEERSPTTVDAVRAVLADPRFRLVTVPPASPQTKPKALDYALPQVRGEFLVVYDAEDVPDPDQLRRAAARFRADRGLACLQAELVPDNAGENGLTALFAGEYAGLFGRLLPALARWDIPVPLGGSSNHFRTSMLREIGGWDAFNVTEDADLGVRIARCGLRVDAFASRTREEAPVSVLAWMAQRRRWMKGWMQTYCVHLRHPGALLRDLGWRGFLGFQVLITGMILSSLLHTLALVVLVARLVLEGPESLLPRDVWDWSAVGIFATGYLGAMVLTFSGLARQRAGRLGWQLAVLPAYWVLHSIATVQAAGELVTAPSHWAKTTHGVTRLAREPALRPRTG